MKTNGFMNLSKYPIKYFFAFVLTNFEMAILLT